MKRVCHLEGSFAAGIATRNLPGKTHCKRALILRGQPLSGEISQSCLLRNDNLKPATSNQQPATSNQQPATNNI